MTKIKILVIPSDSHGVGKFRMINPYTHLQENYPDDFHIDIKFNTEYKDEEFEIYDIIVFNSAIHKNADIEKNLARIEWIKRIGKIVVIDNDDYWETDMRHPMYQYMIREKTAQKRIAMLKASSYVTTTTPFFRDTIMKKLGLKNVFVFPNAIDEKEHQFIPNPTKSEKIRFGWLGGSSHLFDVELLKNGISLMHETGKNRIQFVLCGFDLRGTINEINKQTGQMVPRPIKPEETVWYQYERFFTNDYKVLDKEYVEFLKKFVEIEYDDIDKPYRRRWTKEINKYATNYNLFDISLAPLVDTLFNNNKSQLKAIESGFHKKALIASECMPYTIDLVSAIEKGGSYNEKGNCLLVSTSKNHKQWGQHMKKLMENPNLIKDLGEKLYETVKSKYELNIVNKNRAEFLKSIKK